MPQNISKYVQINDFLLLEYEFNRDATMTDLSSMGATVALTNLGTKQYFNNVKGPGTGLALGITNNVLELNSVPTNIDRSSWFNNYGDTNRYYSEYFSEWDSSIATENNSDEYAHDTIKIHIISGYNFDDIAGFLLQIRAEDTSSNFVDLTNFSYFKNQYTLGNSNVLKFASTPLYLGNKFYDKYVEIKIPSVQALSTDTAGGFDSSLGQALAIKELSDVYFNYSTVPTLQYDGVTKDNTYVLVENVEIRLPVTSNADNFNAYIAESTSGDFIEYYATWAGQVIGQYMADIESGRIVLTTSNNPNDNYEEFTEIYGNQAKWVVVHELSVYESIGGVSSILSQKFSFIQEGDWSLPNYFRPVLKNADIDASYTIVYVCRLSNRMDGTQIIRRASFSSTDPKKYGTYFTRLNVDNIIPYKVFNKIDGEKANVIEGSLKPKTKYVKVFYDTTGVLYNENNELYPQGQGPLLLKTGDSVYKFKFEKFNENTNKKENVDLSGVYNYGLLFVLDNESKIEAVPTYSINMNTTIGELEFKLSGDQISTLLKQKNTRYSIIVKNPNGTYYTFYEGVYHDYITYNAARKEEYDYQSQISIYESQIDDLKRNLNEQSGLYTGESDLSKANKSVNSFRTQIATLNKKIVKLQTTINNLTDENNALKANNNLENSTPDVNTLTGVNPPVNNPTNPTLVREQDDRIKKLEEDNAKLTNTNVNQSNTISEQDADLQRKDRIIRNMDLPDQE